VSASASRLVGGERPCHRRLERALAAMKGTEDCVVMVSGHATNVSTIAALVGPEDLVILDALAHNSMIEGARLSGASRLTMPHADLGWLEETLSRRRGEFRRVLVGVEGLYSMDGDAPDLAALVEIKERHGAWLMVDEAHSVGVLGAGGRGLAEAQGVDPSAVEIWMGTLSKALASCGGYVCGSAALVDFLKARAPGFVFSVGLAPPLAAAAETAIATMLREPERVARLAERGRLLRDSARAAGLDTGLSEGHAVTPVVVGDSLRAVRASAELLGRGVNALPIIHPAVPERAARLRFFVTAEHEPRQIAEAVAATAAVLSAR
jgi:7-keto-8-aminopelargonate synthetase-like enzyme